MERKMNQTKQQEDDVKKQLIEQMDKEKLEAQNRRDDKNASVHTDRDHMLGYKIFLGIWNTAVFAIGWYLFFNYKIFEYYSRPGYLVVVCLFVIAYINLVAFYHAFDFRNKSKSKLIFTNSISILTVDLLIYLGGCLFNAGYIDVKPGIIIAAIQVIVTWIVVLTAKKRADLNA
jgi:hypothetical protein